MTDSTEPDAQTEPTGVSLKAALLLIRELKKSPELPGIEEMASILDDVLKYGFAVRSLRVTEEFHGTSHTNEGVIEFNVWANDTLL